MKIDEYREPIQFHKLVRRPPLSDLARSRLGEELRAQYEPVIDEPLDPRLAELMRLLEDDREG